MLWGAYKGFSKGLLIELSTVLAFILATILGFKLIDTVVQLILPYLGPQSYLPVVAFLLTFVGVLFSITLLAKTVKKVLNLTLLGNLDDLAGAILGIVKWAFILSILLWLVYQSPISIPQKHTQDTVIFPYLVQFGPLIIDKVSTILPYCKDLIASINQSLHL